MKDKLKTGSEAIRGLVKTGGDVVDKALDKSSDVVTLMINNMTSLISKLSDDIGIMADRILTMEERIGLMADRIVRTEELMAKLTASLAARERDASREAPPDKGASQPPVLSVSTTRLSEASIPELRITGDPSVYLLYVSASPLFRDGMTVVSRISDAEDYPASWRRSIEAIAGIKAQDAKRTGGCIVVSVAVRTVTDTQGIAPFSNSIDVTLRI
jgi:hypothetical protein